MNRWCVMGALRNRKWVFDLIRVLRLISYLRDGSFETRNPVSQVSIQDDFIVSVSKSSSMIFVPQLHFIFFWKPLTWAKSFKIVVFSVFPMGPHNPQNRCAFSTLDIIKFITLTAYFKTELSSGLIFVDARASLCTTQYAHSTSGFSYRMCAMRHMTPPVTLTVCRCVCTHTATGFPPDSTGWEKWTNDVENNLSACFPSSSFFFTNLGRIPEWFSYPRILQEQRFPPVHWFIRLMKWKGVYLPVTEQYQMPSWQFDVKQCRLTVVQIWSCLLLFNPPWSPRVQAQEERSGPQLA